MTSAQVQKPSTDSTCLKLLYGSDYKNLLGNIHTGYIGFEREDCGTATIVGRAVALALLVTNLTMFVLNYSDNLVYLVVYFTNWALLLSFFLTLLVFKCSIDPNI